jgi:hypothetical protein
LTPLVEQNLLPARTPIIYLQVMELLRLTAVELLKLLLSAVVARAEQLMLITMDHTVVVAVAVVEDILYLLELR